MLDVCSEIIMGMTPTLDKFELKKLKETVEMVLSKYNFEVKSTELSTEIDDNAVYMNLYQVEKRIEQLSERTINQYLWAVKRFFLVIPKNFRDITSNDVTAYFHHLRKEGKQGAVAMDNTRRFLRAYFNWLTDKNFITKNPFLQMNPLKKPEKQKEIVTNDELILMRDACKNRLDLALLDFVHSTGVRVGELTTLKRDSVNLSTGEVQVFAPKTQKWRTVYLDSAALKHLRDYLSTRTDNCKALFVGKRKIAMTNDTVQKHLQKIAKSCGITKHITVHTFRRTFASMWRNKIDIVDVATLLGHASPETTVKYYVAVDHADIANKFRKFAA